VLEGGTAEPITYKALNAAEISFALPQSHKGRLRYSSEGNLSESSKVHQWMGVGCCWETDVALSCWREARG